MIKQIDGVWVDVDKITDIRIQEQNYDLFKDNKWYPQYSAVANIRYRDIIIAEGSYEEVEQKISELKGGVR